MWGGPQTIVQWSAFLDGGKVDDLFDAPPIPFLLPELLALRKHLAELWATRRVPIIQSKRIEHG
jgi:hypothetical protein